MERHFLLCRDLFDRSHMPAFTLTCAKDFKPSGKKKINTISVIKHEDANIKDCPYVLVQCQQSDNLENKKIICNEVLPWCIRENITIEKLLISMHISTMLLLFSHYKAVLRAKFEYNSVSELNDSIIRSLKTF